MKKLLLAASIAATSFIACATITNYDGFETNGTDYGENEAPASALAAYPFDGFGDKYYAVDEDEEEGSFSFSANGETVFDMFVQFTYREDGGIGDGKLGVYANTDGYLVVVGSKTNVTDIAIAKDSWHRLTIATSGTTDFIVYLDKTQVDVYAGAVGDNGDNSVEIVSVEGSGKLDNFVARTTNPFVTSAPTGWIANIGTDDPEKYFTDYTKALEKALAGATLTFADPTVQMDGTAEHPFEIRSADDLKALADAVNAGKSADKCFVQTANIDMAGAGAFAGIGSYAANPTAGKPFTGIYDGGNFKISNVDFTQRNYGGVFNQVNGGTIKNLTVENITCSTFDASKNEGEWGGAIVGNAGNGAQLVNLTSAGSFGTASRPCTHNVAGIAVRLSEGGTLVKNCTNNATLYGTYTKLGGICALTQTQQTGITGAVTFDGCVNTGNIVATENANGKNPGVDGIAGIVAYTAGKTELKDCENTGSFSSIYDSAAIGELVGKGGVEKDKGKLTDLGGNKGNATKKLVYTQSNVTGFKYATVADGVATTVTTLEKDGAYLLEGDVAASATPVFTFDAAGTISFDAALGYTFAGTVDAVSSLVVTSTSGTVTTYTAAAAVAKIGDTKYTSLAAAVDGAAEGSTIILLANVALTETQTISKSVTLDLNGKNVTATDCRAFHVTAGTVAITGSGTVSATADENVNTSTFPTSSSVIRVGSDTAVTSFTLGENVTVTSDYCYGITYFGTKKQTVVIDGTVTVTGVQAAISGNGLAKYNTAAGGSDVTVNGTVSATQDYAIYNPQTGTTVINGTVTGPGGIEVKAGTVTVGANAQITATGTPSYTQSNQNGTSTVGYAIAAVGNKSYQQPATVSVASGATVTGTVIILKENGSETYGEITSAVNTLTIPAGYVWNGPADGVYTLAVASGFDGGDGKTFTIDGEVTLPAGKALTDTASAASGLTYAQAYALGLLDKTTGELKKDVTPTISIVNGKVVVSLDGTAVDANRYTVMLNVYQKTSLTAEWPAEPIKYELGSEKEAAGFTPADAGFYKVGVTIENK